MDSDEQICDKFMDAVEEGDVEKLKKLTETHGLSHHKKLCDGYVLLKEALSYGQFDVAKLLLTSGAKVNDDHSKHKDTPLHLASRNGFSRSVLSQSSELVDMLLSKGASVDARDEMDCTSLHWAAICGNSEVALLLLRHAADVNCINERGETPLYCAVNENKVECVQVILHHGASVDVPKSDSGSSPLHCAVQCGYVEIAKLLVSHSANINATDNNSKTPLHIAVLEKHEGFVKFLLRNGASVDAYDDSGSSPLHYATKRGYVEIVSLLISHTENVNARNREGQTPLHIAVLEKHEKAIKLLLSKGANVDVSDNSGTSPLQFVTKHGYRYLEIVRLLVPHSANVNVCNTEGQTPMHIAVLEEHEEAIHLLLSKGANVNVSDQFGATPLHYAVGHLRYKPDIARLLVSHSANVNACNKKGHTPLHIAVKENTEEVVKLLLSKGASVDVRDQFGSTPLHYAVGQFKYRPDITRLLVSHSANVHACNEEGQTPLHMAVKGNQEEGVKFLISKGASVHVSDQFGSTPLHYAAANKLFSPVIAQLLVAHCANVNAINVEGNTPLHNAVKNDDEKCVEFFLKTGANVDIPDSLGLTSLHYAATIARWNVPVARLLIPYSTNVNAANINGETPLHVAVKSGNEEFVKLFLSKGGSVDARDGKDSTPLHYAVEQSVFKIAQLLVLHSANVNAINNSGVSPLYIAVRENKKAVVKLLFDNGARVDVCDQIFDEKPKETLLHMAVKAGQVDIVRLLLENGASVDVCHQLFDDKPKQTLLHMAVKASQVDMVKVLLEHGANVDVADGNRCTILFMAVFSEKVKNSPQALRNVHDFSRASIVDIILKHSPDVNNKSNRSSLRAAVVCGSRGCRAYIHIIEKLLRYGFTIESKDKSNVTLLLIAIQKEYETFVKEMLKYSSDVPVFVNSLSDKGFTSLHIASMCSTASLVKLLVSSGGDVNARSLGSQSEGFTPLHFSSKYGNETVVKFLLSSGSDVNAREKCGNTPLFYATDISIAKTLLNSGSSVENCDNILLIAVKKNCTDLVKSLLDKGASVNTKDKSGMTALHFACSSGYENMVEMLLERGANVHSRKIVSGHTGLHLAASKGGHVRIISALLNHGADIDSQSEMKSQLHHNSQFTDFSTEEFSFRASSSKWDYDQPGTTRLSPSREATGLSGKTALYIAVEKGLKENVSALLTYGADINIQYIDNTLLMLAEEKHSDVITSSDYVHREAQKLAENYVSNCPREENWDYRNYSDDEEYQRIAGNEARSLYEEAYNRYEEDLYRILDRCDTRHSFVSDFSQIADAINKHVLLLKSAGFFVDERYFQDIRYDSDSDELDVPEREYEWWENSQRNSVPYSDFYVYKEECTEEIARTKTAKIGSSNSSLYDILVQSPNELTTLCNKENFSEIFESDFINRFRVPIYGNMIRYRLVLAKKRIDLVKNATVCLSEVFFFPDLCIDKILNYLGNTDVNNFIEACQHLDANSSSN